MSADPRSALPSRPLGGRHSLGHARGRWRFALRRLGLEPGLWLIGFAMGCLGRRLLDLPADLLPDAAARRRRAGFRQERAVECGVHTLGKLKGAFVKLGQFAALRYDVLPAGARGAFARLRDQVPALPVATVLAVVEAELGRPWRELFVRFDSDPLGAASMAQVHRAETRDGRSVAVKVQYPQLADALRADLVWVRWGLGLLLRRRGVGAPGRREILDEFTRGLREELDFEREAAMAGEIAENLAGIDRVEVPAVLPELSSRRVLTTSYVPALPLSDRDALAARGIPLAAIVDVLVRAYAKQVFVDGLFHADPHPGNLFVIDEPDATVRPRVLFVDFGLSRRLDPALRDEMRLGLHALLRRDTAAFVDGMERMNMIEPGARLGVQRAVESMFEHIRSEGAPLGLAGAQVLSLKDHAVALLEKTPGLRLPGDLLLYAKTLSYLFALSAELAPDADPMRISTPYLLRYLAGERPSVPGAAPAAAPERG